MPETVESGVNAVVKRAPVDKRSDLRAKFLRGLRNPRTAWTFLMARTRGEIFRLWCQAFRPRVRVGRHLFLEGRLRIQGPGTVIIGDRVNIGMLVTPYTYSAEAVIRIGDDVFLNGTRFGCNQRIDVGDRCILSECRILDYDFHSVDPNHRNDPDFVKGGPVTIEENVWITPQCIVQKNVRIGRDSTITAGSIVRDDIPARAIAGGNPAAVWKMVKSLR